jgi:TRAP-type uncharacterized transport system substrate-binding protein
LDTSDPARPDRTPEKPSSIHRLFLVLSRLSQPIAKRWIALSGIVIPSLLALIFLLLWLARNDPLPRDGFLATGPTGGSYDLFGSALCDAIMISQPQLKARAVNSTGSGENVEMVEDGLVHLGMYQGGTVDQGSTVVVAPLYREVIHVLVKKEVLAAERYKGCEPTGDVLRKLLVVDGLEVYAGSSTTGMRCSAEEILSHYGIHSSEVRFVEEQTASTQVVMATTGMFSRVLQDRLREGDWQYLTLDANAIAGRNAHFVVHTMYRGAYRDKNSHPIPEEDITTVATTAYLIAHRDASPRPVKTVLDALYQGDLGRRYPDLIPRDEAKAYLHGIRLHRGAREYFNPYDYGPAARAMEFLAATKELIVALGAGVYVLWTLRRRGQERQRKADAESYRLRLDKFVDRTVAIESAQIGETDPTRLAEHLEKVTRIKLQALDELTDEELRGDRVFSIFLMQCANLISKLQLKIIATKTGSGRLTGRSPSAE